MPEKLKALLQQKMKKGHLPIRVLLNKFRFPNDEMRLKPEYQDNSWGFWYYLGLEEKPKTLLDVGSKLGLEAAYCVLGAKQPILVTFSHVKEGRFAQSNVKLVGADVEFDHKREWDLGIVNGEFSNLLPSIWNGMKLGGLICVIDAKEALQEFAKVKNRTPVFCELRHNVGLLRK